MVPMAQRHRRSSLGVVAAALALASSLCGHALASLQSSNLGLTANRRILKNIQSVNPCAGIKCPDVSTCMPVSGVPTCVCPRGFKRLLGQGSSYVCSNAALANAEFLDPQNAARAAIGAPPLVWNRTTAAAAASWAAELKQSYKCQGFIEPGDRGGLGQNVAYQNFNFTFLPTQVAMNRWVGTGANYSLAVFDPSKSSGCSTGDFLDCATYLQVVWQYTTQVGCAYTYCGKRGTQLWVCNYYSPGLITSYYPFSPCYKTSCTSPQVCNPNRGLPPLCRTSPCSSVSCPRGATCALSPGVIPYCSCKANSAASRDRCLPVSAATDPAPQTSVAVYPRSTFGGRPFVFRPPPPTGKDPGCVNLPFMTLSIEAIWNVGDASTSGGTSVPCARLAFWEGPDCGGKGIVYRPVSGFPALVQADADSYISGAMSIQCRMD